MCMVGTFRNINSLREKRRHAHQTDKHWAHGRNGALSSALPTVLFVVTASPSITFFSSPVVNIQAVIKQLLPNKHIFCIRHEQIKSIFFHPFFSYTNTRDETSVHDQ